MSEQANNTVKAFIRSIEVALPEQEVTNDDLVSRFGDWTSEKIFQKTGIRSRHVAASNQTAGDLAFLAADKLLNACCGDIREQIDLLVFCTQSPDYALPTTACLLQDRLGLPTNCAAFDYNLGCSGYVYGLSIVKSMIEAGQATKALLLTGETYSKWMNLDDRSVTTIFGDAGTATLLEGDFCANECVGPFVYGTDGSGKDRLIVHGSGARHPEDDEGLQNFPEEHDATSLFMDGPEIFAFTIRAVPAAVKALLSKAEVTFENIDWIVFHQANKFMLEHLCRQCRIPREKFIIDLETLGNTVSNSIPITLKKLERDDRLKPGQILMLVGFGVGYSWSAGLVTWWK